MKSRSGKFSMWLVLAFVAAGLVMPVAAQNRRGRNRPQVSLPGGPVRDVIFRSCTSCHGIDDYAYRSMDRAGWQELIETMKAKGAVISDDDRSVLLDYLVSKFGPDTKPFPKIQVEGAVLNFGGGDAAARDAAAKRIVDSVCQICHTLERVEVLKYTADKWRETVLSMKTKGAQLDDADVPLVVDYLTKTHGPD